MTSGIGWAHDAFAFHLVNHATRPVKPNPESPLEKRNGGLSGLANNLFRFAIQGLVFIGDFDAIASPLLGHVKRPWKRFQGPFRFEEFHDPGDFLI